MPPNSNRLSKPREEDEGSTSSDVSTNKQNRITSQDQETVIDNSNNTQNFHNDTQENSNNNIQNYIPQYLRQFVEPYHGDFCYSPIFHPTLIGQLMIEGFLTIASPYFLLPKLHEQRCIIDLKSDHSNGIHISKSTKKKANRFVLTTNQAFDDIITRCHNQHGTTCWLYPQLVAAFRTIFEQTKNNGSFITKIIDNKSSSSSSPRLCHLRFYSIEVWNSTTGKLAAGELGYTVGSIYTSLTGFSDEDSAGSVQLAALGAILTKQQFTMWDLGMEMGYKRSLGSILMQRDQFVATVKDVREQFGHLKLNVPNERTNCKDIILEGQNKHATSSTLSL